MPNQFVWITEAFVCEPYPGMRSRSNGNAIGQVRTSREQEMERCEMFRHPRIDRWVRIPGAKDLQTPYAEQAKKVRRNV